MKQQMPEWLGHFDDPYGIVWRASNLIRRVSLSRTCKFLQSYVRYPKFKRPVFVLGVPRSGTTMVFKLLSASSQLGSVGREGHDIWRTYHHPRYTGWRSDHVGRGAVKPGERRFINAFLYAYVGRQRLVEKTPENSLRVPYLLDLFPDAVFVVVWRNPCDVINSLINGWRHPKGHFRSYFVPEDLHIPDYPHRRRWSFTLIDGWRNYRASSIPEIAFAQWAQATEALVAARGLIRQDQLLEIFLEDLIATPQQVLIQICRHVGIEKESLLESELTRLIENPVNALSLPRAKKWQTENREAILALAPRIAPLAAQAAYQIDPATGDCTLLRQHPL